MKKRGMFGDKKAQFYLLAAIIIIAVIIGFAGVSNFYKKREAVKVYDLGEELEIEGKNVLDYGTLNPSEVVLDDFTQQFSEYAEQGTEKSILSLGIGIVLL